MPLQFQLPLHNNSQRWQLVFCCDYGDEPSHANAERPMPFCRTPPAPGQVERQEAWTSLCSWMGSSNLPLGSLTNIPFLTISALHWTFTNWGRLEFSEVCNQKIPMHIN